MGYIIEYARGCRRAFTNIFDFLHALVGVWISIFVNKFPYPYCLLSILLFICYVVYEALQKEDPMDSYCDYIEMIIGYIFGELLCKVA